MKTTKKDYYLGFDIGTSSVGYAVTDESYHVLKFNGKSMWGSRLFDEAQTAQARRTFRTNRRRLQRRRQRLELLQELFAEEICKVDSGFFQRLKDSTLLPEDKQVPQFNTLFCDADYDDKAFHKEFPTIYHLRKALITEDKKFDIRLYYLALHHILKHRGHFLFAGSIENATSFTCAYKELEQCLNDEFEIKLECASEEELSVVIRDKKTSKRDKAARVAELLNCDKQNKQLKAIIALLCGSKVKLSEIFNDEALKDIEKPSISFSETSYEELRPSLEEVLQERCGILDIIKAVYDWGILADILEGGECNGKSYLSVAKVNSYGKHRNDLELLKKIIRLKGDTPYKEFFKKEGNDNYCAYVGSVMCRGKKKSIKRCTFEEFSKAIKKIIKEINSDALKQEIEYINKELEAGTFLPLQVSKDNGVVPNQVHKIELTAILDNASQYYPFLKDKDAEGNTVYNKIIKLFEFRIPYYVGPLNTTNSENSWMVRKEQGEILPWNFEQKVDIDQSAEQFIRRMTNKCTYLVGKDVIPKNSLLYSEFMVWNELNNVKIRNEYLSVDIKQKVFDNLFKCQRRVTGKNLTEFLKSEGFSVEQKELSGFDQNFKSSLISYLDMRKIFGEDIEKHSIQKMLERLILWITLYGEEGTMLKRVIRNHYDKTLITDEQLAKICRLKYQGWGRLSKEFLSELRGADTESGELFTIIQALRTTNNNLMQLLSQQFTFSSEIEKYNDSILHTVNHISYDTVMKELVASPAIKRAAWQVVLIAEEIRKIMGKNPKKIFIEMAREKQEKKRTQSRKNQLYQLYSKIKDESREWKEELESRNESDFRSIKLYLYYTQMGRCMYSGEPIALSQLADASVYDRDHIYPQSKTKDDSLDNLVLVKREINAKKSDEVLSDEIQRKMSGFWKGLKDKGLISEEKYRRLTRKTPLSDEELARFINRQLVETRQSSKVVADLFKRLYDDTEIVYVKAKAVSDFRHQTLDMVKVRSLNDYHHAKDAYLNIVVGNVYHEKFTSNPLNWLKSSKNKNYSLNRMFDFDLTKNDKEIWIRGKSGTIKTVETYMRHNDVLYTRYATENKSGQNGGFFDMQIVSKNANASVPIKKGMDVNKYGGYKTVTPAYFALVESTDKKGNVQRSVESVPLYLKDKIEKNEEEFITYCEEVYGLSNPKVILPKIKKDTLFIVDGFLIHLRGTSGKQLKFQCAVQLILSEEYVKYLKKIEKYIVRNQEKGKKNELLKITEEEGITMERNLQLYDELCRKQRDTIYYFRPASQYNNLIDGREKFTELAIEEQCIVLNEVLHLMQCRPLTSNLKLIGGSGEAGSIQLNKFISKYKNVKIINQSVTGLFQQEINLQPL